MSDTNSSAADAHSNMTQPVTATTRLPAPRTPAQYAAAQAHAAQVIQDARSLDLGFRIWPPGRFANFNTVKTQKSRNNENNENIALVSCHGNDSVGYNFSLHVSGATQFSEPGKETGNVLTFARELVKILQDKSEDIEKGARYAAKTLDGSLTQRERYPSDRQAAVKIATLLEGYYSDPTQSKGPADTWSFYGTEKNVLDLVTTSSSQPSQLPPNWPSTLSATPIDLHGTKSFRDREVFVERMLSTSDGPVKVMPFPVRWTGGSKPFTLMEGETVADRTENARLAEIKQQRMAERLAAEQGYGQSSTGSLSQDTTGRTLPFTKDDKRGPRRSSRNRPRMLPRKKAAEASTRQSHLSTHNPTTSAPQSIDNKDNLHYHFSEVSINYRQCQPLNSSRRNPPITVTQVKTQGMPLLPTHTTALTHPPMRRQAPRIFLVNPTSRRTTTESSL
jgi:hypothetical protein